MRVLKDESGSIPFGTFARGHALLFTRLGGLLFLFDGGLFVALVFADVGHDAALFALLFEATHGAFVGFAVSDDNTWHSLKPS